MVQCTVYPIVTIAGTLVQVRAAERTRLHLTPALIRLLAPRQHCASSLRVLAREELGLFVSVCLFSCILQHAHR